MKLNNFIKLSFSGYLYYLNSFLFFSIRISFFEIFMAHLKNFVICIYEVSIPQRRYEKLSINRKFSIPEFEIFLEETSTWFFLSPRLFFDLKQGAES